MRRTSIIQIVIARPWERVYDYLVDPVNILNWMPALGPSLRRVSDTEWIAERTHWQIGSLLLRFTPRNDYGVLDCAVTLVGGVTQTIPIRLVPDERGCEMVYLLRRQPGATDDQFASEEEWLRSDLLTLKSMLESMLEPS